MKNHSRHITLCGSAVLLLACVAPPLLFCQAAIPNVSGNWIGSFDITKPDGTIDHATAFLILKQEGGKLSGSAGATEHQQSPMTVGTVTQDGVHFTISVRPGTSVNFNLRLDGDHLKGEAIGDVPESSTKIRVDAVRIKPASERALPGYEILFDKISRLDAHLFAAFNSRDLATLETCFTKDVEFYHDKEGLTTYQQNMESFRNHFASDTRTRRELVEGTLEVYPLTGYGAVELGVHRFYTSEKGQPERLTATSRFVHVWQEKDGVWKISRVISYDHR